MKIEPNQITEIRISDIKSGDGEFGKLDPISVVLKNYRPGVGKITIECFGKAWSAGWGGMSGQSVEQFFAESNPHYLIGNLAGGISSTQREGCPDWKSIYNAQIDENIAAADREELKEQVEHLELLCDLDPEHSTEARDLLVKVSRMQEWWELWPKEDNPDYFYLKRIVQAVQAGLKQWMSEREPISSSSAGS